VRAQQHLHAMIRDLLAEAAQSGDVRDDIAPDELATYCLHALTAASAGLTPQGISSESGQSTVDGAVCDDLRWRRAAVGIARRAGTGFAGRGTTSAPDVSRVG
jgi:hypothetical protein